MKNFSLRLTPLHWLAIGIILVGTFFRLYNLKNTLHFQGDQGRDALIVSAIFREKDPVFIGPVTSVGNMYLGPLYYYFMLPFLWLSYPSPIGPAYAVAGLSIITVGLLFWLGKKMVGAKAAVIGTFLLALSATAIRYSRFSWNPNPAPLVALLMMYWTYTAWKKHPWHWVLVGICFAVLLQLHYLTLLSAGGAGIIWLISLFESTRSENRVARRWRSQLVATVVAAIIVVVSFTPIVLFDSRHGWLNVKAFQKLAFQEENFKHSAGLNVTQQIAETLKETHGRGMHTLFEISIGKERLLNSVLLVTTLGMLGWLLAHPRRKTWSGELVLASYLLTGILGTALYEHTIFDHYIAYLFPVSFLVLGVALAQLTKNRSGWLLLITALGYFSWYNLPRIPIQTPGWTTDDMQRVSQTIYERVKPGEKYNIVLLSESGDIDGQNYRYFLSTTDKPPVKIEQRGEIERLFIINEDRKLQKVIDSPIYEIVIIPNKEPLEVYEVPGGPEITVLKPGSTSQ